MKKVLIFFHKRFFYFLIGFILGILLMIALIRSYNAQGSTIINSFKPSPSGNHIAMSYTNMGGGAAGYYYTYISFMPKGIQRDTIITMFLATGMGQNLP